MAKFCENCGSSLNEEQQVCLKCGVKVKDIQINNNAIATSEAKGKGSATAGFVLGLVSIIAWIIPLFGYPVTICGIIFSAKGLKCPSKKGMAVAGLVLSIIFLILTLINSIVGAARAVDSYY